MTAALPGQMIEQNSVGESPQSAQQNQMPQLELDISESIFIFESQSPLGSAHTRDASTSTIRSVPDSERSIICSPSPPDTPCEPQSVPPPTYPFLQEIPEISNIRSERRFSFASSSNGTSIRTQLPLYQESLPDREVRVDGGPVGRERVE